MAAIIQLLLEWLSKNSSLVKSYTRKDYSSYIIDSYDFRWFTLATVIEHMVVSWKDVIEEITHLMIC